MIAGLRPAEVISAELIDVAHATGVRHPRRGDSWRSASDDGPRRYRVAPDSPATEPPPANTRFGSYRVSVFRYLRYASNEVKIPNVAVREAVSGSELPTLFTPA